MKIFVRRISAEGMSLDEKIKPEDIGLNDSDIKCTSDLNIKAKIYRTEAAVCIHAQVDGIFVLCCARCLKDFQRSYVREFDLDFNITPKTDYLMIGEDIRQELVLNFSSRALCETDCQGLCADCGTNLNEKI